ncbi:MAG: ribonuclease H-like domain-containing protein [Gammaproteobacteria bacterium]|nr:ribonuclease H-like domain-containing protein [Gammaproteobacteria bacterium]
MVAPVTRLTKAEVDWLATHRCKAHSHLFLSHYNCYLREHGLEEKLGFFDIETSGLQASFDYMLCYCIKVGKSNTILHRVITKAEIEDPDTLDKNVVESCIADIKKFDVILGHYSTRFDTVFLRSRALYWNLDFPGYGEIKHKDTYYMCRNLLKLHSNRLEAACQHVLGKTRKTHLDPKQWIRGKLGDEDSLKYILDHCKKDVRDLEDLYYALEKYTKNTRRSI